MKRLSTIFLFLGLTAMAVGIGLLVRDYHVKVPTYDVYGYAGETNDGGYESLITFLAWCVGGLIALGIGVCLRVLQKQRME